MWRRVGIAAAVAVAVVVAGYGGRAEPASNDTVVRAVETTERESDDQVGEPVDTAEPESGQARIVVLGGSLPTSEPELSAEGKWWVQFAEHVSTELGVEATYDLLSLGSVQDAVAAVSKPGPNADTIAAAEVVLVTVGGGQALPDPETGIGCTTWYLEAEGPCLEEGVATYGDLYDQLFAGVKALRGDEPTVYALTTSYNANIESPDDVPDGLLSLYTETSEEDAVKAWAVAAYDRWSTMQAERATAAGFQVIDVYHAFNGPDGTAALVPAYMDPPSHLNAGGHDLFASKLTEVDLSALIGR